MLTNIFANTPEQTFWKWFKKHEDALNNLENNQEVVLDMISKNLNIYSKGLAFEISPIIEGKREFVISAEGVEDLFPTVRDLVKTAPKLDHWKIVAFRPRMKNYASFTLDYGGRTYDPATVWTYHRIEGGNFDLVIYFEDFDEENKNTFINASYLLLDMALGEYDVTTRIRYIDRKKTPEDPTKFGLKPFSELQKTFDDYKKSTL